MKFFSKFYFCKFPAFFSLGAFFSFSFFFGRAPLSRILLPVLKTSLFSTIQKRRHTPSLSQLFLACKSIPALPTDPPPPPHTRTHIHVLALQQVLRHCSRLFQRCSHSTVWTDAVFSASTWPLTSFPGRGTSSMSRQNRVDGRGFPPPKKLLPRCQCPSPSRGTKGGAEGSGTLEAWRAPGGIYDSGGRGAVIEGILSY